MTSWSSLGSDCKTWMMSRKYLKLYKLEMFSCCNLHVCYKYFKPTADARTRMLRITFLSIVLLFQVFFLLKKMQFLWIWRSLCGEVANYKLDHPFHFSSQTSYLYKLFVFQTHFFVDAFFCCAAELESNHDCSNGWSFMFYGFEGKRIRREVRRMLD